MGRFGIVIALLCSTGCGAGATTHGGGGPAQVEEVLAADRAFDARLAEGDAERFAERIATDAVFLGNTTLRGRNAVVEGWSALLEPDGDVTLRWSPESAEVSACGDLAYTVGSYRLESVGVDGRVRTSTGEYVTVWRRESDGMWRAVVDSGTAPRPSEDVGDRSTE